MNSSNNRSKKHSSSTVLSLRFVFRRKRVLRLVPLLMLSKKKKKWFYVFIHDYYYDGVNPHSPPSPPLFSLSQVVSASRSPHPLHATAFFSLHTNISDPVSLSSALSFIHPSRWAMYVSRNETTALRISHHLIRLHGRKAQAPAVQTHLSFFPSLLLFLYVCIHAYVRVCARSYGAVIGPPMPSMLLLLLHANRCHP